MNRFTFMALAMLSLLLANCAPIQKQQKLATPTGNVALAGIGDVVARVERTRDLKNAFGAADIWGRKTSEGYSELRYAGLTQDGSIIMFRQDLNIETDEDVFTRSGIGVATTQSSGSASVQGSSVTGNATSTTIYSQPRTANSFAIPAGALEIVLPPNTQSFPFSGVTVEVIKVDAVSLQYRIVSD